MPRSGVRLLLGALFFLSGVAALGVETVWLRWFRTLFGATAPAASATLVAFFAGHAAGAALAAFLPARRPLRAYGLLELGAAAAALLVPLVLAAGASLTAALYPSLAERPAALAGLRFAVAVAATFPAAACFGATLPLLGAALLHGRGELGRGGAALYGVNTAGAALGVALLSFVLPDAVGVPAAYGLAVSLSALVGLAALWLSRSLPATPAPPRPGPPASRSPATTEGAAVALAALSGFVAFAAQVLLVQGFAQVLNGSVLAFGAVLMTVLLALAVGAALVSAMEARQAAEPRTVLAMALAAAGLAIAAFPWLLFQATDGLGYVGARSAWPGYLFSALATVAATAGPALLLLALLFPATLAFSGRAAEGPVRRGAGGPTRSGVASALGRLSAANTVGAIAGALAAPWLLLPGLGLWPSFAALGALLAAAAVLVRPASASTGLVRDVGLAAGWVAVMTLASPLSVPSLRLEAGERLSWSRASPAGTVAVIERDGERLLRTDNHSVLGGTAETVHQRRQAHLPLLLHPEARRVAYVGSATGISAGAVLDHPVASLRLVELVPGVAEAAKRFFGDANHAVYADPRTRVSLDDARNFFRATDERYDLVVADLFVPWRAGSGSVYTREHFAAIRAHLAPDGVFCQWLPLYQLGEAELETLVATFLDVFPKAALFRGDFYGGYPIVALVGFAGAVASPEAVAGAAEALAARGETDRWVTDPEAVFSLYVAPLAPFAAALAGVPRNDDAHPRIESLAARGHAGGRRGKEDPVVGLRWLRFATRLGEAARAGADDVYPELPEPMRRAVRGGAALQAAGAFYAEGRSDDSARALESAISLLPRRLVGDAPADPTAAEVWAADR